MFAIEGQYYRIYVIVIYHRVEWRVEKGLEGVVVEGLDQLAAPTEDPEFTEQIENITVPAGRNVKLACSVKNLGSYKVGFQVV
uniref:Ig-like domain-containing protein n=1 Tax=Timema poppense TaxID=170557 RepID=A0A7R9CR99_TIMPO|nr:unnamed protein product [Timema poppensis]